MSEKCIMIVGVGGQGTLLASRIIGEALISAGHDVKLSEVHGMSQRGGSVVTYVKYGTDVHSPIVDIGEADYIMSFEAIEGARWLERLKQGGVLITNTRETYPMPVITGAVKYPEQPTEKLKQLVNTVSVDAQSIAEAAGSVKAVNTVLLGILSRYMDDISEDIWLKAIETNVKPAFLELNKRAFQMGRSL